MEYIDNAIPAIDEQDDQEIPGVEPEPTSEPTTEPIVKPTGVEFDSDHQELDFNDGLGQQDEETRHHQPCLSLKILHRPAKEWQHATPG
jgi:hypothetical protein